MWAIIGGSGFEHFEEVQVIDILDENTPFGTTSPGLKRIKIFGEEVFFLPRHGIHHQLLPHEINYRANIFALKRAGASKILSISAVGSLREELKIGDMVVPTQYLDWTKQRISTFCGDGLVGHSSLAHPVSTTLVQCVETLIPNLHFSVHLNKHYICIEGPAFSTKIESQAYRQLGADIIGMTNFPEYALAKEAGLAYLPCCFVTDYDSWHEAIEPVTLEEVLKVMKNNHLKALAFVEALLTRFPTILPEGCPEQGLKCSLMTHPDHIPADKLEWLEVLKTTPQSSNDLVTR